MSDQLRITAPGGLGKKIAASLAPVTFEKVSKIGFANAVSNMPFLTAGQSVAALRQTSLMQGNSALVIAAGPSLHRQDTATMIRESDFQGVIIATESAMAWCLRHEIVPHLVVTLDPHAYRIVRWFGDPSLSQDLLKHDDYFSRQDMDPEFRRNQLRFNEELIGLIDRFGPRISIAVASCASQAVVQRVMQAGMRAYWWNPMYDDYDRPESLTRRIFEMNHLPCLNTGGNVGTACWMFAHAVLKKKTVGLVGMDFGYYGDTPYEQTQYYKEIVDLVGVNRLDEVFVRFMNPHLSREFYTDPAYLWYRDGFLEMAQAADCVTHNCTGGGILFGPGVHWTALKDFFSLASAQASQDGES